MRLFGIQHDGQLTEYVQKPFQGDYEEKVLEDWLESNPDGILEDGRILIIGRQVATNFGGIIDLLGLDREGNAVVIELKRDRTPRETIAQALEYTSFVERLDAAQLEEIIRSYSSDDTIDLTEYHREYFKGDFDEAVAFNKDQRIVIIGQRITPEIRQIATFLRSKGIRVTCVEFGFFKSQDGICLLSQEIVAGSEAEKPKHVASASLPVVTEEVFLASLDENGRALLGRILEMARVKSMPVHWGSRGFSLNIDVEGTHVAICNGYPPDSVLKQTFRTCLYSRGGAGRKSAVPEDEIQILFEQAKATGLFTSAGRDLKCQITRALTESEIESIIHWCESVAKAIRTYGLK